MPYRLTSVLGIVLLLGYWLMAALLINDYGMVYDSPKNLEEGRIHAQFLRTGQAPDPEDQPKLAYQIHGALIPILSHLTQSLFHEKLAWVDRISAHHLIIPLLLGPFLWWLYGFFLREEGAGAAAAVSVLLITYPHFWGHAFNNLKDVPLLILFTFTILNFYQLTAGKSASLRNLYFFFIGLALTITVKVTGLLILVILCLWMAGGMMARWPWTYLPRGSSASRWNKHVAIGLIFFIVIVSLFFMPAVITIDDKLGFLAVKKKVAAVNVGLHAGQWSLYPLVQIFYATPVPMLILAVAGLLLTGLRRGKTALDGLMFLWLFVVILVASSRYVHVYDGLRLFLVFLIPFCYFTWRGIAVIASWFKPLMAGKASLIAAGLLVITLLANIAGMVQTHPYETTYYNQLAGGLGGAQKKQIGSSFDYWLNSYRQAVNWLNKNAVSHANILVMNADSQYLLNYYELREDFAYDHIRKLPLPPNSYIIVPYRDGWPNMYDVSYEAIIKYCESLPVVHSEERQGGNIFKIYFTP